MKRSYDYYMLRATRDSMTAWHECKRRFPAISPPRLLGYIIQYALAHPDEIAAFIGERVEAELRGEK